MAIPLLFDISGGELLVILLFALLFFGSKGIPDIARTMGRTMRQLRDATDDVRREINKGAQEVKRGAQLTNPDRDSEPPQRPGPSDPAP